jgi:hypothetical protein
MYDDFSVKFAVLIEAWISRAIQERPGDEITCEHSAFKMQLLNLISVYVVVIRHAARALDDHAEQKKVRRTEANLGPILKQNRL